MPEIISDETIAAVRALVTEVVDFTGDPEAQRVLAMLPDPPTPEQAERDKKIRALASVADCDGVEIDGAAIVSEGDDNGAYVSAWVWVEFEGTELDKEGA